MKYIFIIIAVLIAASSAEAADMNKLRVSTTEAIAQGKNLYLGQCMSCHGMAGKGDGPAAVAFNPKPRDFTSGEWKQGGSPAQVFHTLSTGLGSMPAFGALPEDNRWALVHYIRSLSPNTPDDTPATLKLIGLNPDGTQMENQPKKKMELPVEFIMERMAKESEL